MPKYFFLLGNTPELSMQELANVFFGQKITSLTPQIAQLETESQIKPAEIIDILGGTVKILEFIKMVEGKTPEIIENEIAQHLASQSGKISFATAEIGRDHLPKINLQGIKNTLRDQGLSVRFVEGPRYGLSASVLLHQPEITEMNVIQTDMGVALAKTLAVQNIDQWTIRDRSKPYSDRKKGMLPPKLARMMVNIGIGTHLQQLGHDDDMLVYDPFCGTGTVLIEALDRECDVVGSDLDKDSVEGTRRNLEWFKQAAELSGEIKVFQSDVSSVKLDQIGDQVDIIVTEPFLGKQTPRPEQLKNIFTGLERLYLGAFKQWTRILRDGAAVVIVFPHVQSGKNPYTLKSLIDKLANLGYTMTSEPVLYHRPNAIVQRQITTFVFKKEK